MAKTDARPARYYNRLADLLICVTALSLICGCQPSPETRTVNDEMAGQPSAGARLPKLLVVANDNLATAIGREWQARTGDELSVQTMDHAAWRDWLAAKTVSSLDADAIIYPVCDVGTLAESELILPAPDYLFATDADGRDTFALSDILPLIRQVDVTWGKRLVAVPFGSKPLLLVYRADVLEALSLKPPRTWMELHRLVVQLQNQRDQLPPAMTTVIAQPMAAGWAARYLLARAAAYVRDSQRYSDVFEVLTMQPLIDSPPFVRALEELAADQMLPKADGKPMLPDDVFQAVLEGRALLGIGCWPSRPPRNESIEMVGRLGYSLLPGAADRFVAKDSGWVPRETISRVPLIAASGHVGSVLRGTRRQRAAWNLLRQLASVEWSNALGAAGAIGMPFRVSQLGQLSVWLGCELDNEQVLHLEQVLRDYYSAPLFMSVLRIPHAEAYLLVLDAAVLSVVQGEASAQSALELAAQRWSDLLEQHGPAQQSAAYLRQLGIEE